MSKRSAHQQLLDMQRAGQKGPPPGTPLNKGKPSSGKKEGGWSSGGGNGRIELDVSGYYNEIILAAKANPNSLPEGALEALKPVMSGTKVTAYDPRTDHLLANEHRSALEDRDMAESTPQLIANIAGTVILVNKSWWYSPNAKKLNKKRAILRELLFLAHFNNPGEIADDFFRVVKDPGPAMSGSRIEMQIARYASEISAELEKNAGALSPNVISAFNRTLNNTVVVAFSSKDHPAIAAEQAASFVKRGLKGSNEMIASHKRQALLVETGWWNQTFFSTAKLKRYILREILVLAGYRALASSLTLQFLTHSVLKTIHDVGKEFVKDVKAHPSWLKEVTAGEIEKALSVVRVVITFNKEELRKRLRESKPFEGSTSDPDMATFLPPYAPAGTEEIMVYYPWWESFPEEDEEVLEKRRRLIRHELVIASGHSDENFRLTREFNLKKEEQNEPDEATTPGDDVLEKWSYQKTRIKFVKPVSIDAGNADELKGGWKLVFQAMSLGPKVEFSSSGVTSRYGYIVDRDPFILKIESGAFEPSGRDAQRSNPPSLLPGQFSVSTYKASRFVQGPASVRFDNGYVRYTGKAAVSEPGKEPTNLSYQCGLLRVRASADEMMKDLLLCSVDEILGNGEVYAIGYEGFFRTQ